MLNAHCHKDYHKHLPNLDHSDSEHSFDILQVEHDKDSLPLMDPNEIMPTILDQENLAVSAPIMPTKQTDSILHSDCNDTSCSHDEHDHSSNFTTSQKDLLNWHYKLGHMDMQQIQGMIHHTECCLTCHDAGKSKTNTKMQGMPTRQSPQKISQPMQVCYQGSSYSSRCWHIH